MNLLKIAIVGRPNVGKSTLFNRLVGKKLALVDDLPGVTRDRRLARASLGALSFDVIDTAGLEKAGAAALETRMRQQTEKAIAEADLILFTIDAKNGLTPADETFGELVRRSGKPTVLVANKAEGKAGESGYLDSFRLGLGEPVPISAEHGLGMNDLFEAIVEKVGRERAFAHLDDEEADDAEPEFVELTDDEADIPPPEPTPDRPLKLAIVGRPNAGKSTLINSMVGEERLLTGPEAGITRDSISVDWLWRGKPMRLIDTAGLRRKARVQEKLEKLSVADGLRAMQYAEVVIVMLDATAPFEKQDLQIADLVIREGRAIVIALNKWDLIPDRQESLEDMLEKAERLLPQVKGMKVVPVSGKTGEGIEKLMEAVLEAYAAWNKRVSTARLNRWLEGVLFNHPPPAVSGRRIKIKYITQVKSRPPTFVASCSRPESLPDAYQRYLINGLRETFELWSTPIRINLRKADNPFAGRSSSKARKN